MKNIKISKIVFFFSLLIFCTVFVLFVASVVKDDGEPVVSLREEYQTRLDQGN